MDRWEFLVHEAIHEARGATEREYDLRLDQLQVAADERPHVLLGAVEEATRPRLQEEHVDVEDGVLQQLVVGPLDPAADAMDRLDLPWVTCAALEYDHDVGAQEA